ncbi:Type II secretion system protein G [bacterium HR40]|nr:Type II secretion system protein G [bacterium HR40]
MRIDSLRPQPRSWDCRAGERGFTLLELLVVLVVLALLAGLVAPRVLDYLAGAKRDAAKLQIDRLATVLEYYRLDTGSYPSTEQGLEALLRPPAGVAGWKGPYLDNGALPEDPWGRRYVYRAPAGEAPFEILSLGADGKPGGEGEDADISSRSR